MNKEQLMELHQFFVHVYKELVPENYSCPYLELYRKLDVKPHHIHRLKTEQSAAIFLLSACIASYIADSDDMIPKSLSIKLLENAFRYLNTKSKNFNDIEKYRQLIEEIKEVKRRDRKMEQHHPQGKYGGY